MTHNSDRLADCLGDFADELTDEQRDRLVSVAEQIEALRKVAGENVVKRIKRVPDPVIDAIVAGWPRNFDAARATAAGFVADASFQDIIRAHIRDMDTAG